MTQADIDKDKILKMARQVGFDEHHAKFDTRIEAFAKLLTSAAIAKTEAYYMQLFLDPENQPTQFGTATQEYREQEIKEERDACVALIPPQYFELRDKIRARGEPTSRGET